MSEDPASPASKEGKTSGAVAAAAAASAAAARKVLRPLWRSLPFHGRFRIRRALSPARWSCLFRRRRHREELREILARHPGRLAVVCAPHQEWNDLFQRPQQMARALADLGALVFYLTPGFRRDRRAGFAELGPRLYLANVSPAAFQGIEISALILTWLPERSLLEIGGRRKLVYDIMDDLEIFYGSGKRIRRDHLLLARKADLVTVTAQSLAAEVRALGIEPVLLPNAVDLERFVPSGRVPEDLEPILARRKPIVGYQGTLARWFDYGLLLEAARARPGWEFVLVGPADFDDSWDRKALSRQGNLTWLGPKRHEELPDYIARFDAAVIPFQASPITRACSPIKLFECLALGKPVVATALEACRGYRGVFVAERPEDFVPALERALEASKDPATRASLIEEAAANTWRRRAESLWNLIFKVP